MAVPRTLTPPSPNFRKYGFDLGYSIPAAGSCRMEKFATPV